jgi:hypothetical protein
LVVTAVALPVMAGIFISIVWAMSAGIGLDPSAGYDPRTEPVQAAMLILGALMLVALAGYVGALAAAWVALKRYTRAEVESEFCWLVWLPGTTSLNQRVFRHIFPPGNEP